MARALIITLLLFTVPALAADRSKNSGPKVTSFPKSKNPQLEKRFEELARKTEAFGDKKILKVALTKDWGAVERDGNFVLARYASAAIAVFDPENSKCWSWGEVVFKKQEDGKVYYDSADQYNIGEIDCAIVKK